MAADYQQTFESDSVATIFDIATGTIAAIATDQAHEGTSSLKFHQTGSSSAAKRTLTGAQVGVHRFWLRWSATPGANEQAFVIRDSADATSLLIFFIRNTGFLNIQAASGTGSGNTNSASAPGANIWHAIDIRFDTSGTSWAIDWSIDGVSQTSVAATGQVATNQASANFAKSGANTFDWWVDEWQYSHLSADYPLADISSTVDVNAGALAIGSTDAVAVSASVMGNVAGAIAVASTDAVAVSGSTKGNVAGVLAIGATGAVTVSGSSIGGNDVNAGALSVVSTDVVAVSASKVGIVTGSIAIGGTGLIAVTFATNVDAGVLSVGAVGDVEASAFVPGGLIIITRLDDADFDPNFTPYFF